MSAPAGKKALAFSGAIAGSRHRATGKVQPRAVHMVDRAPTTTLEIAARLGVSDQIARNRLARERRKPGPVTWAGLAEFGKQ